MPKHNLNKRQESILEIVRELGQPTAVSVVFAKIKTEDFSASRVTVIRDLQLLVKLNFLIRRGKGRGVVYALSPRFNLIFPIDVEAYFKTEPDKRKINRHFDFGVFPLLQKGIWDEKEIRRLREWNSIYGSNVKKLKPLALKKELERLMIELSWKSSQIEGNTYTLLETEYLLKEHQEPKGHTREETRMILNHKSALDYVFSNPAKFKKISIHDIEDVHCMLIEGLAVEKNLRKQQVRITGTAYEPLDNVFQIREAMEKMCRLVNSQKDPFNKALLVSLLIAYIQPFADGNKRASRLIGNALLLAHQACPLSYRNADEIEYKKAVFLFYEQNNLSYFKELFIEQFAFAVNNYFG